MYVCGFKTSVAAPPKKLIKTAVILADLSSMPQGSHSYGTTSTAQGDFFAKCGIRRFGNFKEQIIEKRTENSL